MSTSFKTLLANDMSKTRSLIYENIPIDGAIADHTDVYGTYPDNTSVNTLYHGMFQQVFDYIASNSSANHVFDISLGVHADSYAFDTSVVAASEPYFAWLAADRNYDSTKDSYGAKRRAVYNMMAQMLVGYGSDGSILKFDKDGDFAGTTTDKYNEVVIIPISRLLVKDGIKKGSFDMRLNMNPYGETLNGGAVLAATHPDDQADWNGTSATDSELKITDYNGSTNYRSNSPAGEYGILYAEDADATLGVGGAADGILDGTVLGTSQRVACGLIYYQAGIVVFDPWLFRVYDATDGHGYLNALAKDDGAVLLAHDSFWMLYDRNGTYGTADPAGAGAGIAGDFFSIEEMLRGYEETGTPGPNDYEDITIDEFGDALRQRISSITFNNTIELNSSVYHCRAAHNEFNYSSNPTYTSASKIVTKNVSNDEPVAYITGVGLYSSDNELLAIGKISEALKKTPGAGISVRCRIDY